MVHSKRPLSASSRSNSSTTGFAADCIDFIGEESQCALEANQKDNAELVRVNQQIVLYTKKIHNEKKRMEQINEKISANEAKLLMQSQTHRVGVNAASMRKHISSLEDRLNQSLVAFNTKVAANKELRSKIDEMRRERCRYDEIYTTLEYEILANADAMTKVLEDGKKRIKSRDKAMDELESLQTQLNEITDALRLDKQELARLQEQFRNEEEKEMLHKQNVAAAFRAATAHSQKSESKSHSQLQDSMEYNHEQMLEEAFAKLKEITGINEADVLVEKLAQLDELNFSRFNYTQELEAESDALEQQIVEAKRELERLKCGDFNHRQEDGSFAEEKRKELHGKLEEVDLQYKNKLNVWERVKTSILTACNELDVSIPCNLVASDGITETNIMEYLVAIETKATELIEAMRDDVDDSELSQCSPIIHNHTVFADNKPIETSISLPNMDDLQDISEDDGDRPLTMLELLSSLSKSREH